MKFFRLVLLLTLIVFVCASKCNKSQEQTNAYNLTNPAKIFPCWSQSWRCGKWHPLIYKAHIKNVIDTYTPDGKVLMYSRCGWCGSIRLIDTDDGTERVVLSFRGRTRQCDHRWRPGVSSWSFEPIEPGDALFIIYKGKMYALLVEQIFDPFDQKISYKIAKVAEPGCLPTKIRWKELAWQKQDAEKQISVGSRKIRFFVKEVIIDDNGNIKDFVSVEYDNCYGCLFGSAETPAHIAIVHKSYLENNPVVDLTKFRFKTWEDGLGNRCDMIVSEKEFLPDKAIFLDLHGRAVRDVAVSPDGNYIVSTGDDGQVVIQYLDESIKKIIGPFKKERLLCLDISRDGTNVLAGGELNLFRSILKIDVIDGKYQEIRIPSQKIMGAIESLFYLNDDACIAYIDAANKLSFFDLGARKLLGSHRIFGGSTWDIAGSPDGNYFAVISMNEVNRESAEPCKLTIFDRHGNETLSYQFASCDEGYYSKITFLAPDCLAVCPPTGKMLKWKWSSQDRKWKADEQLTIPRGPFSAIASSFYGKIVWLAKKQSILAIDTTTGEIVHESSFDVGKCKSKFMAEPITAIASVPNKRTLVLGFCDGRVALMPIPAAVSTKHTETKKNTQ